MNVVFISGIPSVGKTCFLRYAESRGAMTLSLVKENKSDFGLNYYGKQAEWDAFLEGNGDDFIRWLKSQRRLCIIEWGYPAQYLQVVRRIKESGIPIWWFDGDTDSARNFHGKAGKNLAAFEKQMHGLAEIAAEREKLYGPNVIQKLRSDGTFESDETILRRLFSLSEEKTKELERIVTQKIWKVAVPLMLVNRKTGDENYATGTAMATNPLTILTNKHVVKILDNPDWEICTWLQGCRHGVPLRVHSKHPNPDLDLATLRVDELVERETGCWVGQSAYHPQAILPPTENVICYAVGFPKEYRDFNAETQQEITDSMYLALPLTSAGGGVVNIRSTHGELEIPLKDSHLYGFSGSPIMQEARGLDGIDLFLVAVVKGGAIASYITGHEPSGLKLDGTW